MSYETGGFERDNLRQGDIIATAQLVGAICYQEIGATRNASNQPTKFWTVGSTLEEGPVAILSHCCEISKDNGVKLTSIIAAPVRDVSRSTAPEKMQELIDSNVIQDGVARSFLKYFYIPPAAGLPFKAGGVVDYSKLFSLRKTSYESLLQQKVLQLDDPARMAFSLKLALYFHRSEQAA